MTNVLMMCVCCQSWPAVTDDLCEGCTRAFAEQDAPPPPKPADYRFTADDETTIRAFVRVMYTAIAAGRKPGAFHLTYAQRERLRKGAARSIGCTALDLRDCELIWIDELIADVSSPF